MPHPTLIDLSHTIEEGVVTYHGMPAPIICDYMSREESRAHYADGTEFQIGKIEMVANTGTYVDSPFHRYSHGKDLSQLNLEQVAHLDGVLIDASDAPGRAVDVRYFDGLDLAGKAVIVRTDWSRHWKSDQYFEGHPYLTQDAAECLRSVGATMVGIDSLNMDCTDDGTRPVHTILLGADILIVEHMTNLASIPPNTPFKFYAVPVKVQDFGTFPVRAFALIED